MEVNPMAKEKVGTVIEPIETGRTYTSNMFTAPLGDRYARGFHEVYNASVEDRETKMKELYESAMADNSLREQQKHIIKTCYVGFNEAICKNNISTPLIAFVSTKKPVLSKSIRTNRKKGNRIVKSNRLKRTVEDLYYAMDRTGFFFEVAYLPTLIKVFESQFVKKERPHDNDDMNLTFESLIMAALSTFSRACGPKSYANLWYIACFMQNISSLAYLNPVTYESVPQLKDQAANLIKTIKAIQLLEMKRAGVMPPTEEENKDPVNEESSKDA
jgi:hypothetical protein